jgi:hypothetical protein
MLFHARPQINKFDGGYQQGTSIPVSRNYSTTGSYLLLPGTLKKCSVEFVDLLIEAEFPRLGP